jgi:hypothetical protein
MQCDYGGEVTFTACWPDYRLRIQNARGIDIILSKEDARRLQDRIEEVLHDDED